MGMGARGWGIEGWAGIARDISWGACCSWPAASPAHLRLSPAPSIHRDAPTGRSHALTGSRAHACAHGRPCTRMRPRKLNPRHLHALRVGHAHGAALARVRRDRRGARAGAKGHAQRVLVYAQPEARLGAVVAVGVGHADAGGLPHALAREALGRQVGRQLSGRRGVDDRARRARARVGRRGAAALCGERDAAVGGRDALHRGKSVEKGGRWGVQGGVRGCRLAQQSCSGWLGRDRPQW